MPRILTIGTIFLLLALGGAWYFLSGEERGEDAVVSAPELRFPEAASTSQEVAPISAPTVPQGWKKFTSDEYGFSLYVPPELQVVPYDEGGGAHTFAFEDQKTLRGFQIFVVPYTGSTITEERFLKDAPSGVMKDRIDVVVGGITASAFFSEHSLMGETREVWFLHGGNLFEVTTYKQFDAWLAEIMHTWRFTQLDNI